MQINRMCGFIKAKRNTEKSISANLGISICLANARTCELLSLRTPGNQDAFYFGGGRWIRTTEVSDNRFTVCPLWPLGNSPVLLELVKGVEPPTC